MSERVVSSWSKAVVLTRRCRGRSRIWVSGAASLSPCLSSPSASPYLPSPQKQGPLKPARWSGERRKLPQWGRKTNFVHSKAARKPLVPGNHFQYFWNGCFTKLDLHWGVTGYCWLLRGVLTPPSSLLSTPLLPAAVTEIVLRLKHVSQSHRTTLHSMPFNISYTSAPKFWSGKRCKFPGERLTVFWAEIVIPLTQNRQPTWKMYQTQTSVLRRTAKEARSHSQNNTNNMNTATLRSHYVIQGERDRERERERASFCVSLFVREAEKQQIR